LPVRVLSRLFRRLVLDGLTALRLVSLRQEALRRTAFFGDLAPLADPSAFAAALTSLRRKPFSPISRATPMASRSPTPGSEAGVAFKWKDYRIKGRDSLKTMTLDAAEFIRRFLLHVVPRLSPRHHYGLFAGTVRTATSSASAKPSPRQGLAAPWSNLPVHDARAALPRRPRSGSAPSNRPEARPLAKPSSA
jgi:hypothetical protein